MSNKEEEQLRVASYATCSHLSLELSSDERSALGNLPEQIDCNRVRLFRGGGRRWHRALRSVVLGLSSGRSIALGNWIFLAARDRHHIPTLAHELTHAGQYQSWGALRYYGSGLAARVRELVRRLTGIGSSPYDYSSCGSKPFDELGMEQQGQIVEDCFRGDAAARELSPYRPGGA